MANRYSNEATGVLDGTSPVQLGRGDAFGAEVRAFTGSYTMASDASGDTITFFKIPKGYRVLEMTLNASATLGASATLAIGTAAAPTKYRAASTFTAAAPTKIMPGALMDDGPLTDDETIIGTVGTAALPSSGVVSLTAYCCKAG